MRSDRNPYFLLKKSKDPWIQQCLAQAHQMSAADIDRVAKPDLRRAMHFVRELGHQQKSKTTAEAMADAMSQTTSTTALPTFDLWHYQGSDIELTKGRGSVILGSDFVFGLNEDRVFASHQWFDVCSHTKDHLTAQSLWLGKGDQHLYNKLNQQNLSRKFGH